MDFEVIAEGLGFPEGPIVMPDGSVILVEIRRGTLTRVWNGKSEVIAHLGGGPNGAAIGPDGAVYVCNNGGFEWHEQMGLLIPGHAAPDYDTGRIERVDLATGRVERLYSAVDDHSLRGPNDLVFAEDGGFWFTDFGKSFPRTRDMTGLYFATPDGAQITEAAYGAVSLNGVGLAPDGRTVYCADTFTGKLWAFDVTGPGQVAPGSLGAVGRCVATLPGHQYLDSLAVEQDGTVCVATILNGGVTAFRPDGAIEHTPLPDMLVTNIAFGGADMRDAYVTLSSTGKVIKTRWPRPGLKLAFNPY